MLYNTSPCLPSSTYSIVTDQQCLISMYCIFLNISSCREERWDVRNNGQYKNKKNLCLYTRFIEDIRYFESRGGYMRSTCSLCKSQKTAQRNTLIPALRLWPITLSFLCKTLRQCHLMLVHVQLGPCWLQLQEGPPWICWIRSVCAKKEDTVLLTYIRVT